MGKISQMIKAVKEGIVQDVPTAYQACESCRETYCDSKIAATCRLRLLVEAQEQAKKDSS
jgi:hypothetical protein